MEKYIANSGREETISEHSRRATEISVILSEIGGCDEKLKAVNWCAALFHDIGKYTEDFQRHLNDAEYKQKMPHNLISAKCLLECVVPVDKGDRLFYEALIRAVMYHHPVMGEWDGKLIEDILNTPLFVECEDGMEEFHINGFEEVDREVLLLRTKECVEDNNNHNPEFQLKVEWNPDWYQGIDVLKTMFSTNYHKAGKEDDILMAISGNLRCADVLASRGVGDDEVKRILSLGVKPTPEDFILKDLRFKDVFTQQKKYGQEIANDSERNVFAIHEPVGSGKTNAALMAALCIGHKIIYVTPTNDIARNSYNSIARFLEHQNLDGKVSVGLLLTNKWEYGEEFGDGNDIIVTNIDNYLRPVFKSDKRKRMAYDVSYRTAIFDEYHQYFSKTALMASFICVLQSRSKYSKAKTILTSATGQSVLLKRVKEIGRTKIFDKTYCGCEDRRIVVSYDVPPTETLNGNTCFISNSVSYTQKSAMEYDTVNTGGSITYHNRFVLSDRVEKENLLQKYYGRETEEEEKVNVFATNILSTGLNISFKNMVIRQMPLYEIYQAIGRCNRFGEYKHGTVYIDLSSLADRGERVAFENKWGAFYGLEAKLLKKYLLPGEYTIKELDMVFDNIMKDEEYHKVSMNFYRVNLPLSTENLSKINFTYSHNKNNNDTQYKSQKTNLRTPFSGFGDGTTDLFVWCRGMDEGTYMSYMVGENEQDDIVKYMHKTLRGNQELGLRYYGGKRPYNCVMKYDDFRLGRRFFSDAQCSDTPLILPEKKYVYTRNYGLQKISK